MMFHIDSSVFAYRQFCICTPSAKAIGVRACGCVVGCISTPTAKAVGMVASALILARVPINSRLRINSRLLQLSAAMLASVGVCACGWVVGFVFAYRQLKQSVCACGLVVGFVFAYRQLKQSVWLRRRWYLREFRSIADCFSCRL